MAVVDQIAESKAVFDEVWERLREQRLYFVSAADSEVDLRARDGSRTPWHRNSTAYRAALSAVEYGGSQHEFISDGVRRHNAAARAADPKADLGGAVSKHHRVAPRVMALREAGLSIRAIAQHPDVQLSPSSVHSIVQRQGKYKNGPQRRRERQRKWLSRLQRE